MARRLSAAKAKEIKQKKIVIVLAVVFVIVAVVQVPRLMKQLHPKPAGEAAPTPGSVAATSTPTGGAAVAPAASGQLHRFTDLRLKDPFKALVTVSTGGASSSAAATPAAGAPPAKPAAPAAPKDTTPPATPKAKAEQPASGTVSFSAALPPPNAAIVTTNGHRQLVYVGDGFPTADPLFKLVALGDKTVRVGVLGGGFVSGIPTIKLARGKQVTLANEADGSHYVIKLVRLTTAEPKPVGRAVTTPAAAATPAPTTPAATTPVTTTPAATAPATTTTP
jgi:hypothetical protein